MSALDHHLNEHRGTLLYILQQVVLPEAAFQNHSQLMRRLNTESSVAPLLHMVSKALLQCVRIGLINGKEDDKENIQLLMDTAGQIYVHPHNRQGHTAYVVTMPEPATSPEAYFIAIVRKDDETQEYMQESPSTRYFTLEKSCAPRPMLCEVKRDRAHANYGEGPVAEMAAFVDAVFSHIS